MKGHAAESLVQVASMGTKHLWLQRVFVVFFSTSFFLCLKPGVLVEVVTFNLLYFVKFPGFLSGVCIANGLRILSPPMNPSSFEAGYSSC